MQSLYTKFHDSNTGALGYVLLSSLLGCSGTSAEPSIGSGGTTVVAAGGTTATGGTTTPTGTGGVSPSGGAQASGGSSVTIPTGGVATSGGSDAVGGAGQSGGSAQTGGTQARGGATANGGAITSGGTLVTGGTGQTGGAAQTGGVAQTGGAQATGGAMASGGTTATGGATGTGGASGGSLGSTYWMGMDVSFEGGQPEATRANLLSVLKQHGINSIRLRTFVDPKASDGYDKSSGACDLAHTIAFGKQIKAAGMGFLVDFHYSDNWADPGKQCVPIKWQSYTTIAQLATAVSDYTKDAITQLVAGGARPDMVQIGNETTPGMLIHRCDGGGQPTGDNPITGRTSNWANLGALLKAGVDAVKAVDPKILTSFHIAKGGDHTDGSSALSTSVNWLTNALKYTSVDAFGESCYQTYQGDANSASHSKTIWQTVEGGLASKFPNIKIFVAEYGGAPREINDVIYGLPNQQGLGTFYWEPTMAGAWNPGVTLLARSGSTYTPTSNMSVYDQMKTAYASRL